MRVFAITKPGLIAIAVCVAALWACIAAEKVIRHRAESDLRPVRLIRPVPNRGIFTITYRHTDPFPAILEA